MANAHIVGWGKYLPSKIVTNAELAQSAGVDADWVKTRTGIEQRHVADAKQATAELATQAARVALERADISASQLNLIIVATSTPDYLFPATACLVQDSLGADNAGAFDLGAGCSGFVYALVVADRFIRSGAFRYILVVGSDTTSRVVDWRDKNMCPYFGDGAGAVVLASSEDAGGLLSFSLSADGSGGDLLILPGGGSRNPACPETVERGWQYGRMDGRGLYRYGLRAMTALGRDALRKAHLTIDDIDLFIPHQTNVTLIHQVAERLHVPDDKIFLNVSQYSNISSAAIPVALCDAIQAGCIHPGNRLLITVTGTGLTAASVVWQWSLPPQKPTPLVNRFLHAVWDAQAAFRSRMFRLEHRLDTLTPTEEEESEPSQERTDGP